MDFKFSASLLDNIKYISLNFNASCTLCRVEICVKNKTLFFVFQAETNSHYMFQKLGYLITSPENAHISVPIEVTPIARQVQDVYRFSNELSELAVKLGTSTHGGRYCKMLSFTTDQKLGVLNQKLETVIFYLTEHEKYDSNMVSNLLHKRSIPLEDILPKKAIKSTSFSRQTVNLLNQGFQPVGVTYRKSYPTPDEVSNLTEVTDKKSKSLWALFTGGAPSTTTTTTTTTTMATTTTATNATDANISLKNLHQTGVDTSEEEVPTTSTKGPEPLEFPTPFDHFTRDDFFQNTQYPELYKQDRLVKRYVPSSQARDVSKHNPISKVTLNRMTRQVMGVIFGLLASVGVCSIMGGVTAAQIDAIKSTESTLAEHQTMIIHQLESNSKNILLNRNLVDSLGNLTVKLSQFTKANHFENHGMLLFAIMIAEFEQIENSLDTYVAIIESANQGNYHPAILSQEAGIAAFEGIAAKAALKGLKPIINNPQQIAQLETHYSFTPKGVKIIITLPLISSRNSFELYEFQALPIELGPAAYLYLVSDVPLIGIGEPDRTGKSTFVELTHNDLSHCKKLGQIHICDKKKVVRRSRGDSCIYSLYLSDHQQAEKVCRASVEKKDRDVAIAIGHNRFAYYSYTPSTYFFKCQNGSHSQMHQLKGITTIVVPEGCVAETAQFVLLSQTEIVLEIEPKHFEWSQPALDMLGNDTSFDTVDEVVEAYEAARAVPALDRKSFIEQKEKLKPFYANPAPISAVALAITAIVLVLSVIFYIVWKLQTARNEALRLADPRVRMRNLLENNERLEILEQLLADRQEGQAQMQLM